MYYVFDGKNWYEFEEYQHLINWLARSNHRYGSEVSNSFLNYTGNCENDTYMYHIRYDWDHSKEYGNVNITAEYIKRDHRILNEDYNSIYDSILIKDVLNWEFSEELYREWVRRKYSRKLKCGSFRYMDEKQCPEFRRGPWPHIRKYRGGSGFRHIRTTNEIRQSADPEYKQFNRGDRGIHLPTSWDDVSRDWRNDGWKHQGKDKYQWEHGVRNKSKHNHGKGLYVSECDDIKHAWDIDFGEGSANE